MGFDVREWVKDRATENRVEDVRNPGEYNATTWDRIVGGALNINVDQAVDDYGSKIKTKEVDDYLTSIGQTRESLSLKPGATLQEAGGAYTKFQRTQKEGDSETAFNRSLKPLEMEMQATREQNAAQLQLAREKLAQTNNLTLLQMQQSSDQKIAELQYQKQRDRKTDMQYNERMESLDRKDRRAAMSNIAAGLASLGAAFAL